MIQQGTAGGKEREGSVWLAIDHRGHSEVVELPQGWSTLGRDSSNHIQIGHDSVSRSHARLWRAGLDCRVKDCWSTNHTYVNGRLISEASFTTGDQLRFGAIDVIVCDCASSARLLLTNLEASDDETRRSNLESDHGAAVGSLTPGQRRVFELLIKGASEKEVARHLAISQHTVHNHVKEIYRIFEVTSRSELFAKILNNKLLLLATTTINVTF